MTGAKDKSNRGIGDSGRGAAAVVFGSGPAIKEADRLEVIRYSRSKMCVGESMGWITRHMRAEV